MCQNHETNDVHPAGNGALESATPVAVDLHLPQNAGQAGGKGGR